MKHNNPRLDQLHRRAMFLFDYAITTDRGNKQRARALTMSVSAVSEIVGHYTDKPDKERVSVSVYYASWLSVVGRSFTMKT